MAVQLSEDKRPRVWKWATWKQVSSMDKRERILVGTGFGEPSILGGREGGKVEGRVVQWHTTTWLPFESSRLKMLSRPRQVLNSYSPSTAVKTATFCVKSHSCGFYSRLDSLIDRVTESSHWTIRSKSRTLGFTSSHKRLNQSVWDSVFERSVGWLLNKRMTIAGMYSSYAVTKRKPSNPVQVRLFFFFFFQTCFSQPRKLRT